jgi:hypothetical protein
MLNGKRYREKIIAELVDAENNSLKDDFRWLVRWMRGGSKTAAALRNCVHRGKESRGVLPIVVFHFPHLTINSRISVSI